MENANEEVVPAIQLNALDCPMLKERDAQSVTTGYRSGSHEHDPSVQSEKLRRLGDLAETRMVIPREYLKAEPDLMISKWPAYRFMSPRQATSIFTSEYEVSYRECVRTNVDLDQAVRVKPIGKLKTHQRNFHYTQMWVARQHADELGLPYDEYLNFTFGFAMRRTRRKLPRPNQLRPNASTVAAWQAEFEKVWTDETRVMAMERRVASAQYADDNYRELPAQMVFKKQLYKDCLRLDASFTARRHIIWKQLSIEECESLISSDALSGALADTRRDLDNDLGSISNYDSLTEPEFWQACFGMIDVAGSSSATCAICPQAASCAKMQGLVSREIRRLKGSVDPLEDHKKAMQRKHTRDFRARRKAQAALLV